MPVITGLLEHPRRPGRYDVYVDGESAGTVSADAVSRFSLNAGRQLDTADLGALAEEAAIVNAGDRALDLLAHRDRTAAELRRRLTRKGIDPRHAAAAIDRLVEQGIVNDGNVARSVARTKALGAGHSRRRIEQELARKGVARDVAADAIAEVWEEEGVDQTETAVRLARKRLASLQELDPPARRRRLYGFLARRGYGPDDIRRALERVLGTGENDESTGDGWAHV